MPMITVRFATPQPMPGLKPRVAEAVSRLSSRILHKDPRVTAVLAEEAAAEDWTCGGISLAEARKASFWLEIRVTDGTNTHAQKAAFVAAAFETMGELLGPLHEESYVHVHDVRGDAYGYGGRTQESRKTDAKPARKAAPESLGLSLL